MRLTTRHSVVTAVALLAALANGQEAPLRILGEIPAHLERVADAEGGEVVLTVLLRGVQQAIDRGDVLRIADPATGALLTTATVTRDTRTESVAVRAHVRVRLDRPTAAARLREIAAAAHQAFPARGETRVAFVHEHGAPVTLALPFEPENGDDPRNFVRVVEKGRDGKDGGVMADGLIAPHVGFRIRFDRPVDGATLDQVQLIVPQAKGDTTHLVPMRTLDVDGTMTTFRFEPPLGLTFTPAMRKRALTEVGTTKRPHYQLQIAAGLKSADGARLRTALELPITIDPKAPDNHVGYHVYRVR